MKWYWWLILAVFAIGIMIILAVLRGSAPTLKETNLVPQPGDILSIQRSHPFTAISMFTGAFWRHSALCLPSSKGPMVVEIGFYDRNTHGFLCMTVKEWLYRNAGWTIGITRYQGPPISVLEGDRVIEKYKNVKLKRLDLSWIRYLQIRPYKGVDEVPKESVCSEMVMRILQDIRVVRPDLSCTSYTPEDVTYKKFHTLQGRYEEPMYYIGPRR